MVKALPRFIVVALLIFSASPVACAQDKNASAARLYKLVEGKSPEIASARVRAIGAIKTPAATTTLIRLVNDDRNGVALTALEQIVTRVDQKHPSVLPEHHERLVEIALGLLGPSDIGDETSAESAIEWGLKLYHAFGAATDYASFKSAIDCIVVGDFKNQGLIDTMAKTAWFLFCDRSEQPPRDLNEWIKETGEPDAFTFLRLLKTRRDFRPDDWQEQLKGLIASEQVALRLYALQYLPSPPELEICELISQNIIGRYGVYPPVQIASLNVAAEVRSMHFLPAIQKVLSDTEDSEVLSAGRRALKACTPAKLIGPKERAEFPFVDFRQEEVAALMRRVEKLDRVPEAIKQLREITGLDFGDASDVSSRRTWMVWYSREKSNVRASGPDGRPFLVYGRITDPGGNPIPNAWAEAYTQTRLHWPGGARAAYTIADKNGRYLLRFGFGKSRHELPVATAFFRSVDGGRFLLRPDDSPTPRIVSTVNFADDPLLGIKKKDAVFAGQPIEIDFTLYPVTMLKVHVVDTDGNPTWPRKVSIVHQEPGREAPTVTSLRKISKRYYFKSFLPIESFRFQVEPPGADPVLSALQTIDKAGEYEVRLTLNPGAAEGKRLQVSVIEASDAPEVP